MSKSYIGSNKSFQIRRQSAGCSFFITMRCNHQCRHCSNVKNDYMKLDMDDDVFEAISEKSATVGLLKNVIIGGGEPFIDTHRLFSIVKKIIICGTKSNIMIPTNGSWVKHNNYMEIAQVFYDFNVSGKGKVNVRFSYNEWNFQQLKRDLNICIDRWQELEKIYPNTFSRKSLKKEQVINYGRGKKYSINDHMDITVAPCAFDLNIKNNVINYNDYLNYSPDGSCRICYIGGPKIGSYSDDFEKLLNIRAKYLLSAREKLMGDILTPITSNYCTSCQYRFNQFYSENN